MKKRNSIFIFSFFIALLFSACKNTESQYDNDLAKAKLKGKVKSISTRDTNGFFYSNITYNQNGYEIETDIKESDFPLHTIYKRDEKNNVIEKVEEGSSEGNKFKELSTFKYDVNNNLLETKKYNLEGGVEGVYEFKYDAKNNVIEEITPSYTWKYEYKYDKNSNVIEKRNLSVLEPHNPNKLIYKYDNNNNLIFQQQTQKDGKRVSTEIFKYDERNNKIEEANCYDLKANQFQMNYFVYDENDNLIQESARNLDGSEYYKINYKYDFDNHGNWIRRTSDKNGDYPGYIVERTIEYYGENETETAPQKVSKIDTLSQSQPETPTVPNKEVWNGQELGANEKIITLQWDNKTKTGMWKRSNMVGNINRWCSDEMTVPYGKIWVLLYGTLEEQMHEGDDIKEYYGAEIKINNGRNEPQIFQLHEQDMDIPFSEAKDRKMRIYAGSKVTGYIPGIEGKFFYVKGNVYFLEIDAN
ncbi:RHS repeat domain-containing protein [Flavobacterium sp. FlaQc-28]|uniref:RHS repeat domain-containing protein n=1 Tax=Flavobacterium sp. FlaQc-28 TaxID=3374178 RepID=UPI00375719D8